MKITETKTSSDYEFLTYSILFRVYAMQTKILFTFEQELGPDP